MSNEATEKKGGNRLVVIGVAVVLGLLVGGGAGAFFAGPLLASRAEPAAAHAEEGAAADEEHAEEDAHAEEEEPEEEHAAEEEHAEEGSHGEASGDAAHGEAGGPAAKPMYVMENLVLNPARSNGTRFLMATVAFSMRNEAGVTEMQTRELEVRDRVLRVLGSKTVVELADVGRRDSLKLELQDSVGALFRKGSVRAIYLPQFVIQ